MSDTVSVQEAASSLNVSERTIWRWLRSGRLSAERSGGRCLVRMPAGQLGHATAESPVAYELPGATWPHDAQSGPWPYTAENLERRRAIREARRRRAADHMDLLGRETRPDPDALSAVDYIRELRGPIGPDTDIEP